MDRSATLDRNKLPFSIYADLAAFEQANGALLEDTLLSVMEAYLRWNGILGYTAQILFIVEAADEAPRGA